MSNTDKIKTLSEKYLARNISAEEKSELFAWMNDDMMLWMWFKDDIDSSSSDMDSTLQRTIYERITSSDEALPHYHDVPRRWRTLAIAASTLLVLVLSATAGFFLFGQSQPAPAELIVKTNAGERTNVVLPDGTHVRLNAQTTLSYDCSDLQGDRTIRLDGEAYFEVTPDQHRPFQVNAGGLNVQCLGTKFNVKGYGDDERVSVALKEGSVRVTSPSSSVLMQPNTSVTFDRLTARISENASIEPATLAWITGDISYYNERLEDIAKDLSRTFMVNIIIKSPRLRDETFTGYVGNRSLKGVLNLLTKVSDIDYEQAEDSTIYLFEK